MTERERLTELLNEATFGVNVHTLADHLKKETIEAVAGYLLSNGVIVPPIGVGQTLWYIDNYSQTVESATVQFLTVTKNGVKPKLQYHNTRFWEMYQWGKTVFLTREEAEKVLKDGKADD